MTGDIVNSMEVDLKQLDNLKHSEHVFFTFFGDQESKEYKMWNMLAFHDEFRFFTHTNDQEAIEKYKIQTPTVVAFRHFDEPIVKLEGEFERLKVMDFLREKAKADCMYFHEIDKLNIFRAKKPAAFLIADDVRNHHVIDNFCTVAKRDTSDMMYAWINIHDKTQDDVRRYINVLDRQAPVLVMVSFDIHYGLVRHEYDGDVSRLSQKDLEYFIQRFKSGTLERHFYDDQDKTWYHVTVPTDVYYENYLDIVMNKDNDVLIYYYGGSVPKGVNRQPSLHNEINEVSKELGRPDHLVVGRYDFHKAPPVNHPNAITGLLVLYPKNDKSKGIIYKGDQSVDSIKEFLKDNSSVYRELHPEITDL